MSQCESQEPQWLLNRGDLLEKVLSGRGERRAVGNKMTRSSSSHLFWAAGRKANPPSRKAPLQTTIAHLSKPTERRQNSGRWETHPLAAFNCVSPAGQALMCCFHYLGEGGAPPTHKLCFWMATTWWIEFASILFFSYTFRPLRRDNFHNGFYPQAKSGFKTPPATIGELLSCAVFK